MRVLVFLHRWLGAAAALLVFVWFVSGIVMMYHRYPEVTPADRLSRAAVLHASSLRVSVDDAASRLGRPGEAPVRVMSVDGRPVYLFAAATVFADDGRHAEAFDAATARRVAAQWLGRSPDDAVHDVVTEPDQWTLSGDVQRLLPLDRFSWPDGQQVYVERHSATVIQHTDAAARFWAYLGAIPHWLYFPPLRASARWSDAVIASALVVLASAVLGMVIGVMVVSPRRRYRRDGAPARLPYRDWKRWHTVAGLAFGLITITWSFSGLLSMGPFGVMDALVRVTTASVPEDGPPSIEAALMGAALPLDAYAGRPLPDVIRLLSDFDLKELEYVSYQGQPLYLASNGAGDTRVVAMQGPPRQSFETASLMAGIREHARGPLDTVEVLHQHDRYYLHRRDERPLPVILVRFDDAAATRVYVNPRTAMIVTTYTAADWVDRWLYHGLHSFDFPWLYRYRPLWDVVVVGLLLGGAALSATAVVLAWRVIRGRLPVPATGRSRAGAV